MTGDTPREFVQDHGNDVPALVANLPASLLQRQIAAGVIVLLSAVIASIVPFAAVQTVQIAPFIPVVQSIVCVADVITAVLLFAQYSIQPQRALLALAAGYICSGVFAFLQTLDFPGAYSAAGLISGNPSGAPWLFSFWHITFPLAVMAYAVLKGRTETPTTTHPSGAGQAIAGTIACVVFVIVALTSTVANNLLPSMFSNLTEQVPFAQYLAGAMLALTLTAIALLIIRLKTILDLWLIVALLVSLPDLVLSFLYSIIRFSVGWYVARSYALIGSCLVLGVLLVETTMLYARLAGAMILQRRDSARQIMTVDAATAAIAHEIKQPLGAISLNSSTALISLDMIPPDLSEVRSCLKAAIEDTNRASEVVSSIRALFKIAPSQRVAIDINSLVREVLHMVENELRVHGITVSTSFEENLPKIMGEHVQLQQVILNLIRNGFDAMSDSSGPLKALRLITATDEDFNVSLLVHDSGSGIDRESEAQIFDPFFTTKSSGMGLGLPICRKIIEDHGGDLRLAKTNSKGSIFVVTLPSVAEEGGPASQRRTLSRREQAA